MIAQKLHVLMILYYHAEDLKAVKAESSGATLPELPVVGAIFRTVHNLHDNTHLDKLGVAHRLWFR